MNHEDTHREPTMPLNGRLSRRQVLRYGGALGFGAVGASLLASCMPSADGTPGAVEATVPAEAKYLVIMIVDACRADYLKYGKLPNIASIVKRGTYYENAFSGIMESTTPACHASLGTGSFPKNAGGILGFWWEDPSNHAVVNSVNLADPSSATAAYSPRSLEMLVKKSNAPTMAGMLKDVDPTAKIYTSSGVKFYAADAVGGPDADYITYFWNDGPNLYRPLCIPGHELPASLNSVINDKSLTSKDWYSMTTDHPGLQDRLVVDLARKVIPEERPRIVVLNLPEMDWPVAHLYGGPLDSPAVTHLMENADTALGQLMDTYRELGIFHETVFCFMGDHGALPLEKQIDPTPFHRAVGLAGTAMKTKDYHTGAFLWVDDLSKSSKVADEIDQQNVPGVAATYFLGQSGGRQVFLPSSATASSLRPDVDAAYRYLLETMNGPNAPHVVVLYEERTGTLGAGGKYPWKGDHGGASWASQAIPVAMMGPGIRKGYRSAFPARLVDLAPTFLRLLGASYEGMDGVALSDAYSKPTRSESQALATTSRQLQPIIRALKRQSKTDIQAMGTYFPPSANSGSHTGIPLNPDY